MIFTELTGSGNKLWLEQQELEKQLRHSAGTFLSHNLSMGTLVCFFQEMMEPSSSDESSHKCLVVHGAIYLHWRFLVSRRLRISCERSIAFSRISTSPIVLGLIGKTSRIPWRSNSTSNTSSVATSHTWWSPSSYHFLEALNRPIEFRTIYENPPSLFGPHPLSSLPFEHISLPSPVLEVRSSIPL